MAEKEKLRVLTKKSTSCRKKSQYCGKENHNLSMFFIFLITLLIVSLCSFSNSSAKENVDILEELIVTATRYEEIMSGVPANITIITEEDIKNSTAQNIPDLLRFHVGMHVSDITGNRRSLSVDLRGFGETGPFNTLVLIDGRRTNQPDLSGVDWSQLPLERVKRIEIIRGSRASILYGDNATGGVINIITKESDKPLASMSFFMGSYDTFKSVAFGNIASKKANLFVIGSLLKAQGYRDNSETDAKDLGINLNYYHTDSLRLNMSAGYHKDETGLPGALKESDLIAGLPRTATTRPLDFADTEDYYFKLSPEYHFDKDNSFKIDFSLRKRDFLSFSSGDWGSFTGNSETKSISLSPTLLLRHKRGSVSNTLILGFDYHRHDNDIVNESLFFGTPSKGIYNLQKKNYGFYFHDELRLFQPLSINAGFRHDKAEFDFTPSKPDNISMKKNLFTTGANYNFYKRSYFYLSYAKGFRYPLLDELYSFITNTINTGLKPQSSDTYEIGVRHYFTDSNYIHFNLFKINTKSEIFFNPISFNNENLDGKTKREGIEIALSSKFSEWLLLKTGYTYTNSNIRSGSFIDKAIPNVPRHKASAEIVAFLNKGLTITVNGLYVGSRSFISDFSNEYGKQKSFLVVNTKFKYQWKNILIFIDINNLTNKEYAEYGVIGGFPPERSYYPSPKRNFLVGLSLEL
ncbi:MAG: TonB-dependent receptor [Thermodesulfovibrionales bacterium]|nr:TonB-dependent receptor [Thermodesulfovibrionales bacterium]